MPTGAYRLPHHVVPKSYEVELEASPRRKTFSGRVQIRIRVLESTDTIELNARDLKIDKARVESRGKRQTAKVRLHPERETVVLRLPRPLGKGPATLSIPFRGRLAHSMAGLYLARSGSEKAVCTQCEASEARAIFPCWDEPAFKATLQWTVKTDPGLLVVTNGAPQSSRKNGRTGHVTHKFKPTRVLPTYLAALTIGPYETTSARKIGGTPCRWIAPRGKLDQTEFAEEVTEFVLPWFAEYFDQKYHYGKLDQVAVPGFDAGAMENAGALFYRQQLFLMDPSSTSWSAKKEIAEVVAHEIAHQWFGNRVTMVWWDDLWLNEAFATWISHKVVDLWQPGWRIWDEFQAGRREALSRDALNNTHPIYAPVNSPAEATEMFDAITYYKGCCVLRQLETYLGEEPFRRGLRSYIDEYKDANARGADLWAALGKASGQPVARLAESWTTQPGFPVLEMSAKEAAGKTRIEVRQRRFFSNAEMMAQPNDQIWQVPLFFRYATADGIQTHRALLTERSETIELPGKAIWVWPNADAVGFYRVAIDPAMRHDLLAHGLGQLGSAERQCVLEDAWALVVAGLAPIDEFLDTLAHFEGEEDYAVLRTISSRLAYLDRYLVGDEDRDRFRQFVRNLLGAALERLGWDAPSHEPLPASVARAELVDILGEIARDETVLAHASELADQERVDPISIEPNLAGIVVRLASLRGDDARFAVALEEYKRRVRARSSPQLQSRYLAALCAFEQSAIVDRALALCLDGTVPQEQLVGFLGALLSRRRSQEQAWAFLKANWETLSTQVGLMGVGRLVEYPAALPLSYRDDVEAFFRANPVDQAKRAVAQTLEAMDNRASLADREGGRLTQWLRKAAAAA